MARKDAGVKQQKTENKPDAQKTSDSDERQVGMQCPLHGGPTS